MPLQKGQVKNSRAGLNMGLKLDIEQTQNLEVQLFSLNEWKTLDWTVFSIHDLALSALCLCWNSSTGTSDSCGSSRATSSHCLEGEKDLALTPPTWKIQSFLLWAPLVWKIFFFPWSSPGPADSLAGYSLSHLLLLDVTAFASCSSKMFWPGL